MNPIAYCVVRPATAADLPIVARFAAALVRQHHALDAARFFVVPSLEEGYERWLGSQLGEPDVVVLVAEATGAGGAGGAGGPILGYAYGGTAERDWMALRDACGLLHDLYVDESARRGGVARALVEAMTSALRERGAPRLVLSTAARNPDARAFFAALGFRETMVEMAREL